MVVELRNIEKIYENGFHALKGVNLELKKGDILGVIGYSGAGKSTLIRLINCLERPSSGEVLVNGVNLLKLKPKAWCKCFCGSIAWKITHKCQSEQEIKLERW
ncbi:hypothetical protein VN0212_00870 [Helicobacter pylori]|nr:hypothetical protein VN0212_00870 [Helicobacter pylori]